MPSRNSATAFGSVAKFFHWLTALLILSAIAAGMIAHDMAHELSASGGSPDQALLARTVTLFSIHKTLGVTVFFVALARILWALSQPKPGLLNGDNRPEAWLAETVHWLLYGALMLVPLSGWIHHAASTGFAPIWWPFGQSLPFVPKDVALAELASTLHHLFLWVLGGALGLHIAGALKHHFIDGDATLRRMLPGRITAEPTSLQPGHALPVVTALAVWALLLGSAAGLGWLSPEISPNERPAEQVQTDGDWQVQQGTLGIAVRQMGSEVTGGFADWSADITYEETPDATGRHGAVTVTIATGSLSLGSVSDQAKGAGYLESGAHPNAVFQADIMARDLGHVAIGTLTIREQSVPVEMPFELQVEHGTARAQGQLSVDRRDFGIGADVTDEGSLGFGVDINFELTAARP